MDICLQQARPFGCEDNKNSPYLITGIPLDNTVSFRPGTRFAPSCIRDASCNIEFYSMYGHVDVDEILYNDLGDIPVVIGDNAASFKMIKNVLTSIYTKNATRKNTLFILGGEHMITYPVLEVMKEYYRELSYIVFDAHLDLRKEYLTYKYSHASTNRVIFEKLGVKPLIIGARAFSKEELEYAKEHGIKFYTPLDSIDKIIKDVKDHISVTKYVYLSIDMDSIDPAYAPGVSNPEPLGLKPSDVLEIIKRIIDSNVEVKIVDLVEVNPIFDSSRVTCILAAKIIVEITGMIESGSK